MEIIKALKKQIYRVDKLFFLKNVWGMYMPEKHKQIDFLIEELQNSDWAVREDAVELLAEVGDPAAVEPLIKTLKDEDWHVREVAALALGTFSAENAVEPLIEVLEDENENVRYAGALSLSALGNEKALKPLQKAALKDENPAMEKIVEILEEKLRKKD